MISKTMTEQKENTKKTYRYTKQLIRLAIENGYTNQEIAVKAGLSQKSIAVVSRWRNGKALATVRQMQFFINEFEHLLKRKMEHLFYKLEKFEKDGNTLNKINYFKVSGEIILKHPIRKEVQLNNGNKKNVPFYRIVIIKSSNECFYILHQENEYDFSLMSDNQELCTIHVNLSHPSENSAWLTTAIEKETKYEKVIDIIDNLSMNSLPTNPRSSIIKSDLMTLPFILRENMLNLGHISESIEVLE